MKGRKGFDPRRAWTGRRPPLTAKQWSIRFALVAVATCVLAWAWSESGLRDAGMLWENRARAVDYLLGKPAGGVSPQERRAEAERRLRAEIQEAARAEIENRSRERGEAIPSLMAVMRQAQAEAEKRIEAMSASEFEARVERELAALPSSDVRRGGYFPPETSPRAIFGDPEETLRRGGVVSRIVETGESWGVGGAAQWVATAVFGEGYTGKLLETIAIAVWGTLLAVLLALPASVLASEQSLSILFSGGRWHHRFGRWVGRFVMRRGFDVSRGFNEIVLAMIFVAVLGLGPLPGVLALLIHTYGVLGKVFSEAIDTIDAKPVEGVLASGAGSTQVVSFAVLPQIMPYVVSQSLLRFESNVRGATILGVVGAGGIGQMLMDKFGAFEFREVATMMIIIIAVVTLIDFACSRAMRIYI